MANDNINGQKDPTKRSSWLKNAALVGGGLAAGAGALHGGRMFLGSEMGHNTINSIKSGIGTASGYGLGKLRDAANYATEKGYTGTGDALNWIKKTAGKGIGKVRGSLDHLKLIPGTNVGEIGNAIRDDAIKKYKRNKEALESVKGVASVALSSNQLLRELDAELETIEFGIADAASRAWKGGPGWGNIARDAMKSGAITGSAVGAGLGVVGGGIRGAMQDDPRDGSSKWSRIAKNAAIGGAGGAAIGGIGGAGWGASRVGGTIDRVKGKVSNIHYVPNKGETLDSFRNQRVDAIGEAMDKRRGKNYMTKAQQKPAAKQAAA